MNTTTNDLQQDLDVALKKLDNTLVRMEAKVYPWYDLRRQVIAHPWTTVGAAVAVGYLLGSLGSRKRTPSDGTTHQTLALPGPADAGELDRGSVFFVGTATTIIRYAGFTILTDPNFLHAGDHVHLGYGLTSERLTDPAIDIDALPPLDLCLLSHMHEDHWDRVATAQMPKDLPIVTTHEASTVLRGHGFTNTHALNTWDNITLTKGDTWLRISSMPGKHAPGMLNAFLPPVMGSMLEWGSGTSEPRFRMYITGDTLMGDHLRAIPQLYPDIDLALVHLGGTEVFGVMLTMDARQGIQAIRLIHPKTAIPIHYNDYDVFRSPIDDFLRAVQLAGLDTAIHYLRHGDTYTFDVPAHRYEAAGSLS